MSYYTRVLSTSVDCVSLSALTDELSKFTLRATLSGDVGATGAWEQLLLSHSDGREIALVERNIIGPGSMGSEELSEFSSEVADCKPANAATWLREYFARVRCIYAFQLLSGTDYKNGWEILQADNEGFSNEDGYHILWQFSDSVKGDWWMGVLQDGHWRHFQMDLGNLEQREAFLNGQVPNGAKLS
jgi:hypothetical protein